MDGEWLASSIAPQGRSVVSLTPSGDYDNGPSV